MANESNQQKINKLRRIGDLIYDPDMLNKIGLAYRRMVKIRTEQGKDIRGRTFRRYSKQYAQKRKRMGEPTHLVNLTIDHAQGMLQKLDHVVFNDMSGVQAYINDPQKARIGRYHAITGAGTSRVIRQWWGLSDSQKDEVQTIITTELDEIFKAKL